MKNLHFIIGAIFLISPILRAQDMNGEILMTIHDRQITVEEFERIYHKNNSNTALEQQTVDEYLELFINFKLKVIEAEEMGLDTTDAFLREFNGYKKQLAKPYLSDKEEVDALVQEAFERSQKELQASHILVRLNEFAGPEDTALAYTKAMEIRDRFLAGEDFGILARTYSNDPSAKDNAGMLGWFTTFRMVYPFETGAYNTAKGDVSLPVRTRFGYHLIHVTDERPARGEVQVAHIMVMVPESMSDEEKAKARKKIQGYYDSLRAGKEFSAMAMEYSEDRGSAGRGGELPWFGTGRMVGEFKEASFALTNIGDISEPVQTSYGWHIITLLNKKTFDDFEAVKADLQSNVTKSDRNVYSKAAMIERLKQKYNFREYTDRLHEFHAVVDTGIFLRTWEPAQAAKLNKTLFIIGDREINQRQLTSFLASRQGGRHINIEVHIYNQYQKFVEEQVLQYEEDQLPDKYPEFRHLVQEYHDGILLFDLTDKMVWSKAVEDSAGLEAFYQEHKNDYRWGKRMDATIYTCRDKEVALFARKLLEDPKNKKTSPENIQSHAFAQFSDSTCLTFAGRKLESGDHALADNMDWSSDKVSDIQTEKGKEVFLVNNKLLKPSVKELDECRGLVTADYQNHLEKEWIAILREKYPVENYACLGCPVGCGRVVKNFRKNLDTVDGPEYETAIAFGPLCMNFDLDSIIEANHLCNRYGMDTISAGVSIAYAMYLYEKKVLTKKKAGMEIKWGDAKTIVKLVKMIAEQKGIGKLLSQGTLRMAREFGRDEGEAAQIKGLEVPMHEGRAFHGLAISYATGPRGACHLKGDYYNVELGTAIPEYLILPGDRISSEGKAEGAAKYQSLKDLYDALTLCKFTSLTVTQICQMLSAITGWEVTPEELLEAGDRSVNIKRAISNKLGLTRKDDRLPKICLEVLNEGSTAGTLPDMDLLLKDYYSYRKWDWETGRPSKERLQELGMSQIADDLYS